MKENFRCPFSKCKFKNDSLLNIFYHMETIHNVKIKNVAVIPSITSKQSTKRRKTTRRRIMR